MLGVRNGPSTTETLYVIDPLSDASAMLSGAKSDPQACYMQHHQATLMRQASQVLLFFFMFFSNIVWVNLLVAMMTDTYTKVKGKSEQRWRMQQYQLIKEYSQRANRIYLPPPLTILEYLYHLSKLFLYLLQRFINTIPFARHKKQVQSIGQAGGALQAQGRQSSKRYIMPPADTRDGRGAQGSETVPRHTNASSAALDEIRIRRFTKQCQEAYLRGKKKDEDEQMHKVVLSVRCRAEQTDKHVQSLQSEIVEVRQELKDIKQAVGEIKHMMRNMNALLTQAIPQDPGPKISSNLSRDQDH